MIDDANYGLLTGELYEGFDRKKSLHLGTGISWPQNLKFVPSTAITNGMPNLKSLKIMNCMFGVEDFITMFSNGNLKNLVKLDLGYSPSMMNKALKSIGELY